MHMSYVVAFSAAAVKHVVHELESELPAQPNAPEVVNNTINALKSVSCLCICILLSRTLVAFVIVAAGCS